jgi:hypothetical protein
LDYLLSLLISQVQFPAACCDERKMIIQDSPLLAAGLFIQVLPRIEMCWNVVSILTERGRNKMRPLLRSNLIVEKNQKLTAAFKE